MVIGTKSIGHSRCSINFYEMTIDSKLTLFDVFKRENPEEGDKFAD